jgi:site-specific recombinase XerD
MSVNDFYLEPSALVKYQINGPLTQYFNSYADWLIESHFEKVEARKYLTTIAHFNYYLSNFKSKSDNFFTSQDINNFVEKHIPKCHCHWWGQIRNKVKVNRSIKRFCFYLSAYHNIDIIRDFPVYGEIYQKYLKWMKEKRFFSTFYINSNSDNIKSFFIWCKDKLNAPELSTIKVCDIERFLLKDFKITKIPMRRSMQTTLRNFFQFCYETSLIDIPLHNAVPTIKKYKLSNLPKAIQDTEALKFLKSIDRSTNSGKRLYAITRLLYEYGIRGIQVRTLKIDDIDWKRDEIRFPAAKGGKSSIVPLSAEAGNALIDYLVNVRPNSSYKEIFLSLFPPHLPLKGSTLSISISSKMKHANITSSQYGSHCFRYGFINRLIKQKVPYKNIADLVGHRHIATTFIYTKIDKDKLAEVALELPEGLK